MTGIGSTFALVQYPKTCEEYDTFPTESIFPAAPEEPRKFCVLVFSHDASKPPRYYVTSTNSSDDLKTQLRLGSDKKLVFGYVVQETYSEWNPLSIIGGGGFVSTWEDLVNLHCTKHDGIRPSVWIVKKNLASKKCLDIYADKYQRWGYALVVSSKSTADEKIEFTRKCYGNRYDFEWQHGNGKDIIVVKNPEKDYDTLWTVPMNVEAWEDASNVEFFAYSDYVAAMNKVVNGSYTYQNWNMGSELMSSYVSITKSSETIGSLTMVQNFILESQNSATWIGDQKMMWLVLHMGELVQDREAFDAFVRMMRLIREMNAQHVKPYNIKCLRYNRITRILGDIERALPFSQNTYPSLATVMPGITLRSEQNDVLTEVLRRETDLETTFEQQLFVNIGTSIDGTLKLFFSPFLKICAVRSPDTVSKTFGGVIVADLGWGKTVLTFALIAVSPRQSHPTLVVVPTKVMMSQWKTMCDSMTNFVSYMYSSKTDACPNDFPDGVDIIFTTYAVLKKSTWLQNIQLDRVIYDEIHELQKYDVSWSLKTDVIWGLTATIASVENPSVNKITSSVLRYHPHDRYSCHDSYQESLFKLLTVKAPPSSKAPSWSVTSVDVPLTLPESVKQTYKHIEIELINKEWNSDDKMAVIRLHKAASGFSNINIPSRRRIIDLIADDDGEGTSNGRKRKMPKRLFEETECPICMEPPTETVAVECGHMFCKMCITTWFRHTNKKCPVCRNPCGNVLKADVVKSYLDDRVSGRVDLPREQHLNEFRVDKALETINGIQSTEKIVIFSHYYDILKCLGRKLKTNSIGYVDASASNASKTLAANLASFDSDPECRVMLLNTKTHSAGLNLTSANHVIFVERPLDSTWYTQGVGRIARDGQTKDVSVQVFVSEMGF